MRGRARSRPSASSGSTTTGCTTAGGRCSCTRLPRSSRWPRRCSRRCRSFLHSRACHADFVRLLTDAFGPGLERLARGGVVHSFTGTADEARELVRLGLHIGLNGCSLKTADGCAVVAEIPLDRLMLETDAPWCEVRPSHEGWKYLVEQPPAAPPAAASSSKKKNKTPDGPAVPERFRSVKKEKWVEGAMVKGRNEPCMIERVAKIVAGIKGLTVEEVCEAAWANTVAVFGLDGGDEP